MRLFIALPLPENVKQYLGKITNDLKQKEQKNGKVKWVDTQNIHLTMKFLGETDESKVESISTAIKKVATKHSSVTCTINKIGAFPNLKRPKVVWAGMQNNIDKLEAIAIEIENEMANLNFEKENRRFKSHLTLGRVKDNKDINDLTKYLESYQIQPKDFLFDKIVLFKSTLTPDGPIYERLYETNLGGFVFE